MRTAGPLRRLAPLDTRRGHAARWVIPAYRWRSRHNALHRRLESWARAHPTAFFVQIGANDGDMSDPIVELIDRHDGWSGILVEPLPEAMAKLRAHRDDPARFRLVEAAVTTRAGEVTMTTIDVEGLPSYTAGMSSLDRETILRHEIPGLEDRLHTVVVPAVTFGQLVHGVDRIDLLLTDTEGHDAVILDQIDLRRWRIGAVMYESKHLSSWTRGRVRWRFRMRGYRVVATRTDTLAIRRSRGA